MLQGHDLVDRSSGKYCLPQSYHLAICLKLEEHARGMSFCSDLFGRYTTVGCHIGNRYIFVGSSMCGLDQWQGHTQHSRIYWFFHA
jgi:hypothetical protein